MVYTKVSTQGEGVNCSKATPRLQFTPHPVHSTQQFARINMSEPLRQVMAVGDLQQKLQELIDDIRLEMRDYKELNRLIQDDDGNPGVESSDKVIAKAIKFVLDAYNGMPPPIPSASWDNFPNRSLLITGVIARLLRQVATLDDRNFYPANDGQVGIPSRQKGQIVRGVANQYWQEFQSEALRLKMSINFRRAQGGVAVASEAGMILLEDYLRGRVAPVHSVTP